MNIKDKLLERLECSKKNCQSSNPFMNETCEY